MKARKTKPNARRERQIHSPAVAEQPDRTLVAPTMKPVEMAGIVESEHWLELKATLGKSGTFLKQDPIYSIPKDLLKILRLRVPEVLGDEHTFDLKFSEFCHEKGFQGFWMRKAFCHPLLGRIENVAEGKSDQGYERSLVAERRMQGYLGWLVTEAAYREELAALRKQGRPVIEEYSDVLQFNSVPTAEDFKRIGLVESVTAAKFLKAYQGFCRRWCLDRLVTWDLPQPRNPSWSLSKEELCEDASAQGVVIFLPHSFIRHGAIDLADVFAAVQDKCAPQNLRNWLKKDSASRLGQGEERYASLFLFQHYWKVIHGRLGNRKIRAATKIKAALGEFLADSASLANDPGRDVANKIFALMKKRRGCP